MKWAWIIAAFAEAVLFASANVAMAGIAITPHNLGSTGVGPNTFSGTAAICVFCHTPHGADTDAVVPLWNRRLNVPTAYKTYNLLGTSSLTGAVEPVGSVSIACLSCHDGTIALNVMINAPGSGGYNPAGAPLAGTWTGPVAGASPVGSLNFTTNGATTIFDIGTDLTNDHPIGIQYGGGGAQASDPDGLFTGTLDDPTFHAPYKATINGKPIWWVDSSVGATGKREKTDIQLFTRVATRGVNTGAEQPYVECASCHNPHESVNPTFLRISNTGSALCLTCHIK
jgi:predicted CXXCH cytochrome family protein